MIRTRSSGMAKMQEQLKKLANQLSELDDSLYLQKELENKAGLTEEEARKLAEKLAKMDPKQLEKELQRQLGNKGMSEKQLKELAKRIQQQQKAQKACQNMGAVYGAGGTGLAAMSDARAAAPARRRRRPQPCQMP